MIFEEVGKFTIKEAVARSYVKGLLDVACEMNIIGEVAQDFTDCCT